MTEPSVTLHETKGVNPRMTCCERCGKENGVILLGRNEYSAKCRCGITMVGVNANGYIKLCPKCAATFQNGSEVKLLPENARIPNGLCEECTTEIEQHADIVKAGGVYWKCEDCKASGVIKPEAELSIQVRKEHPAPEQIGVNFTKEDCPVCRNTKPEQENK